MIIKRLLLLILILVGTAGFGPLQNMSHIIYEEMGGMIRVTMQMNYEHGLQLAKLSRRASDPQDFRQRQLEPIFQASLGRSRLLMSGQTCVWGRPGGLLSRDWMQMQVVAQCKDISSKMTWYFDFLSELPEKYVLSIDLHFADGQKASEIVFPSQPVIQRKGSLFHLGVQAAIPYLGFSVPAWITTLGRMTIPPGFLGSLCVGLLLISASTLLSGLAALLVFLVAVSIGFIVSIGSLNSVNIHEPQVWLAIVATLMSLFHLYCLRLRRTSVSKLVVVAMGLVQGGIMAAYLRNQPDWQDAGISIVAYLGFLAPFLLTCLGLIIILVPWIRMLMKSTMHRPIAVLANIVVLSLSALAFFLV